MNDRYCVVTFHVTQHALQFEKHLKEHNLSVKLMPVPRQLSSSCGNAAFVDCKNKDIILALCRDIHLEIDAFHELESTSNEHWFLKILNRKK